MTDALIPSNALVEWRPSMDGLPEDWRVVNLYLDRSIRWPGGTHYSAVARFVWVHDTRYEAEATFCERSRPPGEWLWPLLRALEGITSLGIDARIRDCDCYY